MYQQHNNIGHVQYFKGAKSLPCGKQAYGRTKAWFKSRAKVGDDVPIRIIRTDPIPCVNYELDRITEIDLLKGVVGLQSGWKFFVSGHEYGNGKTGLVDMLRPDDECLMAAARSGLSFKCEWGEYGEVRVSRRL